jgi:cathepsin D
MTLNGVNETLYSGNITYHDVTDETYWLIEQNGFMIDGVLVEGTGSTKVAIDTGTSLLGGPADGVAAVFAQIPGSAPSETYKGYYEYPCRADFNVSIAFGGIAYPLNPQDFNLGYVDRADSSCLAA